MVIFIAMSGCGSDGTNGTNGAGQLLGDIHDKQI